MEFETKRLKTEQHEREHVEQRLADRAPEPEEAAQHERRAEKAHYLREKLEERERSEHEADG
jgi:hypothetical protein